MSHVSSALSERDVIAYLVQKHLKKDVKRQQEGGVPLVSLGQTWQPWINWSDPKEGQGSDYLVHYNQGN